MERSTLVRLALLLVLLVVQTTGSSATGSRTTIKDQSKNRARIENVHNYYDGDRPISMRDATPAHYNGPPPGAFKCRAMQNGASFTFAHEWVHLPATDNCNLILMGNTVSEMQWSDIVQQAYKLQNELEYDETRSADGKSHKVNHKLLSLGFLWQKYLAPRARFLKEKKPKQWTSVKAALEAVGCPLFSDNELPDALHPAWWADVGFTANKQWTKSREPGLPPDDGLVHDITGDALSQVAEGVLSWDSFRWFKGTTLCTPMVRRRQGSSGGNNVVPVTSREVRAAVTALWITWCGASRQDASDVGACAGDFQPEPGPTGWANAHPGFTYNPIGGAISLGAKAATEIGEFSFLRGLLANRFESKTIKSFRNDKQKGRVQRCAWNLQHDDRTTSQDNIDPPEIIPRDVCFRDEHGNDASSSGTRLREYAPFSRRKAFDDAQQKALHTSPPGGKELSRDALRFQQLDPLKAIRSALFPEKKKEKHKGVWSDWFIGNSFDESTHYGVVSNPFRKLDVVEDGVASVVSTEVDAMSIAGMVPFGGDRSNCMVCWTAPVWIANLLRLCGGGVVEFFEHEGHADQWTSTKKPVVYGCGRTGFSELTRGKDHADNQKLAFLHAKLFEGLPEESLVLPGWESNSNGGITGCDRRNEDISEEQASEEQASQTSPMSVTYK